LPYLCRGHASCGAGFDEVTDARVGGKHASTRRRREGCERTLAAGTPEEEEVHIKERHAERVDQHHEPRVRLRRLVEGVLAVDGHVDDQVACGGGVVERVALKRRKNAR
jgi:hypothetical protein